MKFYKLLLRETTTTTKIGRWLYDFIRHWANFFVLVLFCTLVLNVRLNHHFVPIAQHLHMKYIHVPFASKSKMQHTNNPPEKSTKTKAHKQMNSIQRKTTAYAYLFCRYSMRNKNSTNWTCFRLNNIVLKINFFATRSSLLLDGWRGQSKRQTVCDAMNKNTQTHNQTK